MTSWRLSSSWVAATPGRGSRMFRSIPGRLLLACCIAICGAESKEPLAQPDILVREIRPGDNLKIVVYGDMRFTKPSNTSDTNPRVRKWLVDRIAQERPDALFVSGDIPFQGGKKADWDVYRSETAPWVAAHLRVYPAIGNHEVRPKQKPGLANYFAQFPELQNKRWYAVKLGSVYLITLDSNSHNTGIAFDPGSPQRTWLDAQLAGLPPEVNFVFVMLHMPLINDVQSEMIVDIPEPSEVKLRGLLEAAAARSHAKFIVVSGHIHNYERFEHNGVSYIVSGGGGAKPYPVYFRNPEDLYQGREYPNFNYIVLHTHGKEADAKMYRVKDPKAPTLDVEVKDTFTLRAK